MDINSLSAFLRSVVPPYANVQLGEDDMLCIKSEEDNAEAYIKYSGGLDFSLQGVRNGEKSDTKTFSFRNEHELVAVIGSKVLELLDGERRI